MATLNLDLDYFTSIKTVRLKAVLGKDSEVLPIKLACYVGKHHGVSGSLAGYSAHEIESLVEWWGKPGEMVGAMIKVGLLLKKGEDNYALVNWKKEQGHIAFYIQRARNAAKKRWESDDATSIATSNAKGGGEALLGKKRKITKEKKEVYPLLSPLASPLLSPDQEKKENNPVSPFKKVAEKTANGLSPQEKSALLGNTELAEDDNDGGHSPPLELQNILKSIVKTEDIESGKGGGNLTLPLQDGNPEKIPKDSPAVAPADSGVSNSVERLKSLASALQTPKNGQYPERFETIWQMYPSHAKIGKKAAFKHFKPSVRTENDFALIKQALSKYLASKRVKNGYVLDGDAWFNNWRDWIYYEERKADVWDPDVKRDPVTGVPIEK